MNKGRLEAFTDAIIAIAATIMVLELRPPEEISLQGLASEWTVFFAYLVSFSLIYLVWYEHHNAFKKAEYISTRTYIYNGFWLFFLTLVPFTTNWVGEHPDRTLPEVLYVLISLLWSIAFQVMDNQIVRDNPHAKKDSSNNLPIRLILCVGYPICIIAAFVYPLSCLLLLALITVVSGIRMMGVK